VQKYSDYIAGLGLTQQTAYGKCKETCEEMLKHFPELTLRAGFYECPIWGRREHWWLTDPAGNLIDPTAVQFPSQGIGDYKSLEPDKRPRGKCPNCGEYCYNGEYVHVECDEDYRRYLMTGEL
jgi:hypothetical protein